MARRSGFLAEMQRQSREAARRAEQQQKAAQAAARRAEAARRTEQRAAATSARATEAERKKLEREAVARRVQAMQDEAARLNDEVSEAQSQIANILSATLEVDDFFDLESLKLTAKHPPFSREDLEQPTPSPDIPPLPVEPQRGEPEAVGGLFGRKRRKEEAAAKAEADFVAAWNAWKQSIDAYPEKIAAAEKAHAEAEERRRAELATAREEYALECAAREEEVAANNRAVDALISNLSYGVSEAVEEYFQIVFANSLYPDGIEVTHDVEFDPSASELRIRVQLPGPDRLDYTKSFRYVKAKDEIIATEMSARDSKALYTNLVEQAALRTLHEVFEADRRALVKAVSLEVGTETADPATGKVAFIPLSAVAVTREKFDEIDLSAVVPSATLKHLAAVVSKSPFDLIPAGGSGVRRTH